MMHRSLVFVLAAFALLGVACSGGRKGGGAVAPPTPRVLSSGTYQLVFTAAPVSGAKPVINGMAFRVILPKGLTLAADASGKVSDQALVPGSALPTARLISGKWQGQEVQISLATPVNSAWAGEFLKLAFTVPVGVTVSDKDILAANAPLADYQVAGIDTDSHNSTVLTSKIITTLTVR